MKLKQKKSLLGFFLQSKNVPSFKKPVPKKYYFIIASEKFLLKEEPLEEVLRERFQYCLRESKYMNFWLIQSPKFLETSIMEPLKSKIPKKFTAIVSTNEPFIRWLKLRYHHVGIGSFFAPSRMIENPFSSK
ncbi:MAG: DUF2488 family protein [Sphaerochaetaceae bacterium]|nr:DUF2488 family protein [Sphaerochaetaceae bacterium]